jgi:hypothetical protein
MVNPGHCLNEIPVYIDRYLPLKRQVTGWAFLYRICYGRVHTRGVHCWFAVSTAEKGALKQGDVKVKKTIWMPLVLGAALGLVDFISLAVNFLIPLGPLGATGPQEIFLTISAALGGPLGLLVASFLHESGVFLFFLKNELSPDLLWSTGVLFATADLVAHLVALPAVAYCYRFLYQRAQKLYVFCAGWILVICIYYGLLVFLQFFLLGLVVTDVPGLSVLYQNNLPEFAVVAIVSTLIWVALPARYRKPLWYEMQPLPTLNKDGTTSEEIRI